MGLLLSGSKEVVKLNHQLTSMLFLKEALRPVPINETYWEHFQTAIDRWHDRFNGSYYLHALMEVSVVAHEIRWAAREAKAVMNMISSTAAPATTSATTSS